VWGRSGSDFGGERPSGLDLRHLAALEAIARHGSFYGAASALGYAQSAISQQIAMLERAVGVRLVERRGSARATLTDAGKLLLLHAEEILAHMREAEAQLAALAEGQSGTVSVGSLQSASTSLLPRVLAAFARTCPSFRVRTTETQGDGTLFRLLEAGELDLAFCELPAPDGPFTGTELVEDPYVLLVAARSPFASREEAPSLEEIATIPLIGFTTSRAQDAMLELLAGKGIDPRFVFRSDFHPTLQAMVGAGLGVAIVPFLTVDPAHPGTVVIELPELPARRLALVRHRDREYTAALQRFTEAALAVRPRFRRTPPATGARRDRRFSRGP
jgi:DNA-binding transcriptional LysR family regulator